MPKKKAEAPPLPDEPGQSVSDFPGGDEERLRLLNELRASRPQASPYEGPSAIRTPLPCPFAHPNEVPPDAPFSQRVEWHTEASGQ